MAPGAGAGKDLLERLAPPSQANFGGDVTGGDDTGAGQFVIERIEGDDVSARAAIGDKPAGEPAIGVDPADLGVEVDPFGQALSRRATGTWPWRSAWAATARRSCATPGWRCARPWPWRRRPPP